jgi:hypothetical protein
MALDTLVASATALLTSHTAPGLTVNTPALDAFRRAYQLIAADLTAAAASPPGARNYEAFSGFQADEKLAALTVVIRHTLWDLSFSPPPILEVTLAQQELAAALDILYHAQVADAFNALFDAATKHLEGPRGPFWHQVCVRCLGALARLPDGRAHCLVFLRDRPGARREVELMIGSADPNVAGLFRALGEAYVQARRDGTLDLLTLAPSPYALAYIQYDGGDLPEELAGATLQQRALLGVNRAARAQDVPALTRWFTEGSATAAGLTILAVREAWPISQYEPLLESLLAQPTLEPARRTLAILEVGRLNRAARPQGGEPHLNDILVAQTATDNGALAEIGRLAVRELGAVGAINNLLAVAEFAPIIEIAEEPLIALRDLRQLGQADSLVRRRSLLQPAYSRAQQYLQEVQSLTDAAWACQAGDMAEIYINRLRALKAIPELERLTSRAGVKELAQQTLSEMRLEQK